jgi:molecular chaperone HtpG
VLSAQLERVLRANSDEFQLSKRIFEVNPKHPLTLRLCELSAAPSNDVFIKICGQQLFSNLLILDGVVTNPHDVTDRVLGFMQELAQQKSPANAV